VIFTVLWLADEVVGIINYSS